MTYLELGECSWSKRIFRENSTARKDKNEPKSLNISFFSLLTVYDVYFFLSPRYPKKNPPSEKMEINPASIWILADNKVKRNDSWVTNMLRVWKLKSIKSKTKQGDCPGKKAALWMHGRLWFPGGLCGQSISLKIFGLLNSMTFSLIMLLFLSQRRPYQFWTILRLDLYSLVFSHL